MSRELDVIESLLNKRDELLNQNNRLRAALESIRIYGSDTLSGRTDGPDDREWQREAVAEMARRAAEALQEDQR